MEEVRELQPVLTALPEAEASRLVQRVVAARGLTWPAKSGDVQGIGGFEADLSHFEGREAVVWATLTGQQGVLGLVSGDRLLAAAGKELGQIKRVQPLALPGVEHLALMVDDEYDNLTGGFMREERRRIYIWDGRSLRTVFTGKLKSEQFRHARWVEPTAPHVWRMERAIGEVDVNGGELIYNLHEQRLEAVGRADQPVPPPERFKLVSEKSTLERLRWNPRLRRYEPA